MEDKFAFAKVLIKEAASLVKTSLERPLTVSSKASFDDLVTNVDQSTQDFLVEKIKTAYPKDFILAEEGQLFHDITDDSVWVLDPIDGTVNFVAQQSDFVLMLSYFEEGAGKFALIYDVMADRLYSGGGHFDVYLNDQKLQVFEEKSLSQSLIGANSGMYLSNHMGVADLIKQSLGIRIYGSAGISMGRVLEGKLLAYFSCIYPWDYAAASILGEKLGYVLLTMTGEKPDFASRQDVMFVPKAMLDFFSKKIR